MPSDDARPTTDHPAEAVVRHPSDATPITWDDPVRGRLRFRKLLDRAVTPTGTLSTGLVELSSDGWLGRHRHPQPEVYSILEGRAEVEVDGSSFAVGPGSCVFIPGDAPHSIRNVGAAELRFAYTFAVDSLDEVAYRWS